MASENAKFSRKRVSHSARLFSSSHADRSEGTSRTESDPDPDPDPSRAAVDSRGFRIASASTSTSSSTLDVRGGGGAVFRSSSARSVAGGRGRGVRRVASAAPASMASHASTTICVSLRIPFLREILACDARKVALRESGVGAIRHEPCARCMLKE